MRTRSRFCAIMLCKYTECDDDSASDECSRDGARENSIRWDASVPVMDDVGVGQVQLILQEKTSSRWWLRLAAPPASNLSRRLPSCNDSYNNNDDGLSRTRGVSAVLLI